MKENQTKRLDNYRNSSIELLRIIAMMGVVILHYNNGQMGGGFQYVREGSINQMVLFLSESLFIGSVNLFVMISGYFLCKTQKRRFIKVVELVVQVLAFSEGFYLLRVISGTMSFSVGEFLLNLIPKNYFVILYATLYFISPYFNLMIDKISKQQYQKLLILLMALFSIWTIGIDYLEGFLGITLNGSSTIGCYGSQAGYTIVNFAMMYMIGAYIRIYGINFSKQKNLICLVSTLLLIFMLSYIENRFGSGPIATWNYNNPLVIIFATLLLLYIIRYSFESRIINELAKGAFTCFLFHTACLPFMKIQTFVNSNFVVLIFHQILVGIALYLVSYLVYKVYTWCTGWFIRMIQPACSKLDM